MSISERLSDDFKKALKSGDRDVVSVIRMIKAAVKNKEIEKGRALNDEEICAVLMSFVRQRKESIDHFLKGNRQDLVEKEKHELSIIQSYLPPQFTEEEIKEMIKEAIVETGASSLKDMGKVMKFIMSKAKGQVDGKVVSEYVKRELSN
jgi:hypothetical protein